ncbi:MAG: DUF1799 domain-containing protein [Pseudomonadota bacterium]|nr:DUF1799 domain-containing protein [Pseudomonadota bacterium]
MAGADFLRDGGSPDEAATEVEVLSENWTAVRVYQRCVHSWITGMHTPLYVGIPAIEIESAARLCGIAPSEYPDMTAAIDVMVDTRRRLESERQR